MMFVLYKDASRKRKSVSLNLSVASALQSTYKFFSVRNEDHTLGIAATLVVGWRGESIVR